MISRLLRAIDFGRARTVVQLGVGTGCITRALLRRMSSDSRLLSVELNHVFIEECRDIVDPRLTMRQECAGSLRELIGEQELGSIDYVVSSLPLGIMDEDLVDRILHAAEDLLAHDGMFLQYQYSLSQRSRLERRFGDVRVGFTLANIPPAFVYECSPTP